jgi:small subunit ribosomal protein S4
MGDIKKLKKQYNTPMHPWSKVAIEEEGKLMKEYGLSIKREIFIANTFLKKYKNIAKKLIARKTPQGEKEKKQIMEKLQHYGLLPAGAGLDQILSLETKDVLERRVQSLLFRKNLARSMKQARQFIVHRHILIGDKEITSPSTLLTSKQESMLNFKSKSSLASEDHPERAMINKDIKEEIETIREQQKELAKEAKKK